MRRPAAATMFVAGFALLLQTGHRIRVKDSYADGVLSEPIETKCLMFVNARSMTIDLTH